MHQLYSELCKTGIQNLELHKISRGRGVRHSLVPSPSFFACREACGVLDSRLGRGIIVGAEKSRARIMHAIEIRIVIHNYVNKNKTDTLLWLAGKNQLQDTTTTKKPRKNLHCCKECSTYVCWRSRMAKREREDLEEFEVDQRSGTSAASLSLAFFYGRLHSPLSVQCHCTMIFTTTVLYNDLYQ